MTEKEITFVLPPAGAQMIMEALSTLPIRNALGIYNDLIKQLEKQGFLSPNQEAQPVVQEVPPDS